MKNMLFNIFVINLKTMKNKIVGIILFLGFASLFYPLLPALMSNIAIIGMYLVKQITVLLPYMLIAGVFVFGIVKFANKI